MLEAARQADPDDPRTVFYLGQSYRDAGQPIPDALDKRTAEENDDLDPAGA